MMIYKLAAQITLGIILMVRMETAAAAIPIAIALQGLAQIPG